MLDWFLHKGMLKMEEEGELKKTASFPKDITFKTDENGITKFYYDYKTTLIEIHPNDLIDE